MLRRPKCKKAKKLCYPTREDALAVVEARKLLGAWTENNGSVRAYLCNSCGRWHLTSMSRKAHSAGVRTHMAREYGVDESVFEEPQRKRKRRRKR